MLQTRNGKRTAQAALQIACDLVDEGMITEQEAVLRMEPKQLDTLLHPQFDAAAQMCIRDSYYIDYGDITITKNEDGSQTIEQGGEEWTDKAGEELSLIHI